MSLKLDHQETHNGNVLIYSGHGTFEPSHINLTNKFRTSLKNGEERVISYSDISVLIHNIKGTDTIVLPGGATYQILRSIEGSVKKINKAVMDGTSYFGVCAGAYSIYNDLKSSNFVSFKEIFKVSFLNLNSCSVDQLCSVDTSRNIKYPIREKAQATKIKIYDTNLCNKLENLEMDVLINGAPALPNTGKVIAEYRDFKDKISNKPIPAITKMEFGKGQILAVSPHLELDVEGALERYPIEVTKPLQESSQKVDKLFHMLCQTMLMNAKPLS